MQKYMLIGSKLTTTHDYDVGSWRTTYLDFEACDDVDARRQANEMLGKGEWSKHAPTPKLLKIEEVTLEPSVDAKRRARDAAFGKEIDEHPIGAARKLRP